jgi:hypothetical protein
MAYKRREDGISEVYDLDFAGYCLMRELPVVDMLETAKNGKDIAQFVFAFLDKEGLISQLSVDYTNSESAKHADCVRRIKKAIRSTKPRER